MNKTTNYLPGDYRPNDLIAEDEQGRFYRVSGPDTDKAVATVIRVGEGVLYYVRIG